MQADFQRCLCPALRMGRAKPTLLNCCCSTVGHGKTAGMEGDPPWRRFPPCSGSGTRGRTHGRGSPAGSQPWALPFTGTAPRSRHRSPSKQMGRVTPLFGFSLRAERREPTAELALSRTNAARVAPRGAPRCWCCPGCRWDRSPPFAETPPDPRQSQGGVAPEDARGLAASPPHKRNPRFQSRIRAAALLWRRSESVSSAEAVLCWGGLKSDALAARRARGRICM